MSPAKLAVTRDVFDWPLAYGLLVRDIGVRS